MAKKSVKPELMAVNGTFRLLKDGKLYILQEEETGQTMELTAGLIPMLQQLLNEEFEDGPPVDEVL